MSSSSGCLFMVLLKWILVFISISFIASTNCQPDSEKQPKKEKKQLSPARLRAEGDAAFTNRDYNKAIKWFNQLIGMIS